VQNVLTIVQTKLTRAKDDAAKAQTPAKAAAPVAAAKRRK
jgi:hypothetical protein